MVFSCWEHSSKVMDPGRATLPEKKRQAIVTVSRRRKIYHADAGE